MADTTFSFEDASQSAPSSGSFSFEDAHPKKAVGALSYIGQQAKAGLTADLPTIAGKALQYAGATDLGGRMRAYGEENAAQAQPDETQGAVTKMVAGAVRGAAPIVPLAVGGLAANVFAPEVAVPLELAGAAGLAGGFGGAQAQDTLEKAKAAGLSDEAATSAARKTGLITGVGMGAVGALTGGIAAPLVRGIAGTGAKTAVESLAETAAPSFVRPFVADTAGHLVGNVASMAAANAGTAAVEREAGLPGPTPSEAALEGVESGASLTAALLSFGAARTALARRANTSAVNRLQSADADPEQRAQIAAQIHANLTAIDPQAASHFADNVSQSIDLKQPIELGEHLLKPFEAKTIEKPAPVVPQAPDLSTSPGAALPDPNAVDFTREVDTSNLALTDPQEEARQRAATVDFTPPDMTPDLTTQPGAAATRTGLDMPGRDIDTSALALKPSEAMGIDANAGPISRAAAIAVDTGAHDKAVADAAAQAAAEAAAKGKPKEKTNAPAATEAAPAAPDQTTARIGEAPRPDAGGNGAPGTAATPVQPDTALTRAAHEAATSPFNDHPAPTQAQQEAGNYKKGHVDFSGLDVSIENPVGSSRTGVDPNGKPWSVDMSAHYGYIRKTKGADGDHVDAYIAATPHPEAKVYVVDQHDPAKGFDEHKVVLGARDAREAAALYDAHFSDGSGPTRRRAMTAMSMDEFKTWLKEGDTTKPVAARSGEGSETVLAAMIRQRQQKPTEAAPVNVIAQGRDKAAARAVPAAEVTNKVPVGAPFRTRLAAAPALRRAGPGHEVVALEQGGFAVREIPKESKAPAEPKPLSIGMTPNSTEPVSVKDGVVHIGKNPAVNFETGDPVKVKAGATHDDIKQALRDASALSRRQRFFGGDEAAAKKEPSAARATAPAPTRYGKDGVELAKGGEPFATRAEADKHRKESNEQGRTIQVEGGFAVRDVTDAELKARTQAGNRLQADARKKSRDANPMLAFLGEHGLYHEEGKRHSQMAEFSPGKNVNVKGYGNIFRADGKAIDLLAEQAAEEGFLPPGNHDTEALSEMIRRAIAGHKVIPQYAEGAVEAEHAAQLAKHKELAGLEAHDLEASGYGRIDPELQEQVRALIAKAEQGGIDHEAVLEDVAKKNQNASTDEYHAAARAALEDALKAADAGEAGARAEDRGGPAGAQASEPQGQAEGLTAPTEAEVLAQQSRKEAAPALDEKAQIDREAKDQTLTQPTAPEQRKDTTGDLLGGPTPEEALAAKRKAEEAKAKPKDDDGTAPMFSRGEKPEPFYSALSREVDAIPAKAQPGMGWQAQIKGLIAKGKVKADEVAWTGLDDWLKLQQGKVTKEQIGEFLKNNGVQVKDVTLGDEPGAMRDELHSLRAQDRRHERGSADGLDATQVARLDELEKLSVGGPSKYGQYTLPGGNNYREVLLTLPDIGVRMDQRKAIFDEYQPRIDAVYKKLDAAVGAENARLTNELRALQDERNAKADAQGKPGDPKYLSSHWDEPNVLAHIRLNDRVDADGKKVLFVEELQSDWAQEGKKKGFLGPDTHAEERTSIKERMDTLQARARALRGKDMNAAESDEYRNIHTEIEAMDARLREIPTPTGVPQAPFVDKTDAWVSLALKRIIKMAADEGYDKVAFVNGEQSADRYSLAKVVDKVLWSPQKVDGFTKLVELELPGEKYLKLGVDDAGRVIAARGPGFEGMQGKALEDVVGKGVAEKILADPAGNLSGDGLKIGGEGMRAFYDRIVPSVAKDVLKKLGGDGLNQSTIVTDKEGWHITPPEHTTHGKWMVKSSDYNSKGLRFETEAEAKAALAEKQAHSEQTAFDITPAMREKAEGGLPLFKRGEPGTSAPRTADIRKAIAPAVDKLKVPFTLHDSVEAARAKTGQDIPDGAKGMHWKGGIHLFAENLRSPLEAEQTLWHEVQHAGLREMYGKESEGYENALRGMSLQNGNIRDAARAWLDNFGAEDTKARIADGMKPEDAAYRTRLQAIDEALAELAGRNAKINGITRFIAKVQEFMRAVGLNRLADALEKATDAQALAMIFKAREAVMKEPQVERTPQLAPAFSKDPASYSRALDKASDTLDRIKGTAAAKNVDAAWDGVLLATAPQYRSDAAREMGRQLIAGMGEKEMKSIKFRTELNRSIVEQAKATTVGGKARDLLEKGLTVAADKVFLRATPEDNRAFMQAMDTGDQAYFDAHPQLKPMADVIGKMFTEKAREVQSLGTGALQAIRENYFPHIWSREPEADKQREIFTTLSKRPLEGQKGFTKARVFEDVQAGLDAGFEPISNNPLDIVALKMEEMDKYILAHRTLNAMEGSNGVHLIAAGEKTPKGFTDVNGRFGSIERNGEKLRYVARDDVAQVINNYLSPSLYHNKYVGKPFTAYMGAANMLNQFQLGVFSAFHAGFTSMEAVISHASIGVKALTAGDFKGAAKYLGSAPAAWINNPKMGSKIIAHMMDSAAHPEMGPILEGLQMAGFKWQMDNRFRTDATKNMLQAWQEGKKFKAGLNSIPAIAEQTARPILEWLVPRQKFGVFGEMYSKWMQDNPNATHEELRNSAQQIWNRVDSRLGQVVYDRLFVHNVAKNFAQMLIRAPGWTGGTILEVGGGIKDLAGYAKSLVTGKIPESISDRAAYTLSMLMVTATANALLTSLFTGSAPEDWKDLVAFRTGNLDEHGRPERFMLPTYMKDVYAYANAPGTTLLNKAHPLLSLIGDVGRNRDFYGTEIRSEDDNLLTQLAQTAGFTAKAFVPFWVKGVQKEQQREGSAVATAAPLFGVMPAPSDLNKSEAEKLMTKYSADRLPQGSRTQEETEKADLRRQMYLALRKGEQDKAKELFDQGRTAGLFGARDYLKVVRQARQDPLVSNFAHLTYEQAERVMRVANEDERQELAPAFMKKRIAYQRQHAGMAAQ